MRSVARVQFNKSLETEIYNRGESIEYDEWCFRFSGIYFAFGTKRWRQKTVYFPEEIPKLILLLLHTAKHLDQPLPPWLDELAKYADSVPTKIIYS